MTEPTTAPDFALNALDAIERLARLAASDNLRGVVVFVEQLHGPPQLRFMPKTLLEIVFPAFAVDAQLIQWIATYDVEREYILMNVVAVNDEQADAQPFRVLYRTPVRASTA